MNLNHIRFGLYARKSTTEDTRQVLSKESQIDTMKEKAVSLGLNIVRVFDDSQTAHKPHKRTGFNQMLEAINEGEIDGILVWKADRLARNPIEGGSIIYLLQNDLLKVVQTEHTRYLPTDNMLPLTIELGMANQYSLDLSKNVKRGNKTKINKGGHCNVAPCGYLNDKENKTIVIDPDRFHQLREMWELLLTGSYSVPQICNIANDEWGFRTIKRKRIGGVKLSVSSLHKVFTNPFYYGRVKSGSHSNWGNHEPMVTQAEFERAQEILRREGRKAQTSNEFPFTGLMSCGECSAAITAEVKVKYACPACKKQLNAKNPRPCNRCKHEISKKTIAKGHWYTYYRCTKKKGRCDQKYVKDAILQEQIDTKLASLEIDPDFENWAMGWLKALNQHEFDKKKNENGLFQKNYQNAENRIKRLIDMRADREISKEQFFTQKQEAERERDRCKQRLGLAEQQTQKWIDKAEEELSFVQGLCRRFEKGTIREKKFIVQKIGSNFVLKDRKLSLQAKKQYLLFKELQELSDLSLEPRKTAFVSTKTCSLAQPNITWLGRKDSNPRSSGPKPAAVPLGHSPYA
jgi:site-specific DNA recombinase